MNLFSDLLALKTAVESGNVTDIWSAFKKIGDDVAGPTMMQGVAGCDPDKCEPVIDECVKACHDLHAQVTAPATNKTPKGKFGDGTFLKMILPLIIQFLPLIFAGKQDEQTPTA